MDHELIELLERAGIEEEGDPLACSLLPFGMLALDALLATAKLALALAPFQFFFVEGHVLSAVGRRLSVVGIERSRRLDSPESR